MNDANEQYSELAAAVARLRRDPLADVKPATDAEIAQLKALQDANRKERVPA